MEKIKAFFQNKITKIVSWVVLALSACSLIVGGISAENVSAGVVLVAGIISAIAALVAFITSQIKSKE